VSGLPANLAAVADDLARATQRDALRARRRRRAATLAVVLALLALTASAAIATGWLSNSSSTRDAVGPVGPSGSPVVLLAHLGGADRSITAVSLPDGSVCLTLTGYPRQCVTSFLARQETAWFMSTSQSGPTVVWGIAREEVTAVDVVTADGRRTPAELADGAFYAEVSTGQPTELRVMLENGRAVTQALVACSVTNPNCSP
jgi:hypothetical protein